MPDDYLTPEGGEYIGREEEAGSLQSLYISHIPVRWDFEINQSLWLVYTLTALYISVLHCLYIARYWGRVRRGGKTGVMFLHLTLVLAGACSTAEMIWNEIQRVDCKNRLWTVEDCLSWKKPRNILSAFTEGTIILFAWLRSRTFYTNPLMVALFAPDSLCFVVFNWGTLVATLLYPFCYVAYSLSHFWMEHHQTLYCIDNGLCYERYPVKSVSVFSDSGDSVFSHSGDSVFNQSQRLLEVMSSCNKRDLIVSTPHEDPFPMIVTTFFYVYQILLHVCVLIPFLVPLVSYLREEPHRKLPEVSTFLRKCLIYTGLLLAVNIATWITGSLLSPFMPVSKFMLDAIADSRNCIGLVLSAGVMKHWQYILFPCLKERVRRGMFGGTTTGTLGDILHRNMNTV